MTAPPRDHWCSLCPSLPTIGEPPRLICMPAAMGYPAVPAFGAAQKFDECVLTGWFWASSAPRDTSSFHRRLALSGFLLRGQTLFACRKFRWTRGSAEE